RERQGQTKGRDTRDALPSAVLLLQPLPSLGQLDHRLFHDELRRGGGACSPNLTVLCPPTTIHGVLTSSHFHFLFPSSLPPATPRRGATGRVGRCGGALPEMACLPWHRPVMIDIEPSQTDQAGSARLGGPTAELG